jgi:hypothetical protein
VREREKKKTTTQATTKGEKERRETQSKTAAVAETRQRKKKGEERVKERQRQSKEGKRSFFAVQIANTHTFWSFSLSLFFYRFFFSRCVLRFAFFSQLLRRVVFAIRCL